MPRKKRIPAMSSRKFVKLLRKAGADFDRWGKGDHAIYRRESKGAVRKAPVLMGKKELRPEYCLMVFRQLGMTDGEIDGVL
jgi:predicted RNA binding protein YcfA (HicA-like mRNA interferase family)